MPGNLDRLEELAERGVIGLKAFMSNSGIDEFAHVDDVTLYEGMAIAARLGLPVAVHAENDALTARSLGPDGARLARLATGRRRARGDLAGDRCSPSETGCALHVVHVSSGRGVALVDRGARARRRRDLRDLPALPLPDAGRRRGARRDREVRAARARRRSARACGTASARSTS